MYAQVVLGSFMHIWDCVSDVYVVWLWHTAGRTGLVAAGVVCIVLSPLVTCIQGFNVLWHRMERRRAALLYAALSPLNVHNMVYGYLVLKDAANKEAYTSFTFLKGMHGGIQSLPLALMTGVDLLTGGAAVGELVKITSLALSVFSICFTTVIYSCSVYNWGAEAALELFMLTCGDVLWLIMALAWTVGALSLRFAGLAIGVAYGAVWVSLYLFMTDMFAPDKRKTRHKAFLEAVLVPFRDTFGFRASMADDILARKRAVCWVVPFVSGLSTVLFGACTFVFDLGHMAPDPVGAYVRLHPGLEPAVAVTRRLALLALSITHLVASFSALRLGLTIACAVAQTYFTLRLRGYLSRFGVFSCSLSVLHSLTVQPVTDVLALIAKKASPGSDEQTGSASSMHTAQQPAASVRPADVTLSDEEAKFFDVCDLLLASERGAAARAPCAWRCLRGGADAPPAASAEPVAVLRAELRGLLQECAALIGDAARSSCRASASDASCAGLDAVTKALDDTYVPPSIPHAAKIERCCQVLRALMDGTAPQLLAASSTVVAAAAPVRAGLAWRRMRACTRRMSSAAGGAVSTSADVSSAATNAPASSCDEEQTAGVQLYAISLLTAADASVWGAGCDAKTSFNLAKKVAPHGSVDFFLSHTWGDDAAAKTAALRTFLFMQSFSAVSLISTLMFALTFVPAGCIAAELDARIPWWSLSVASAGLGLALLAWGIACHAAGTRTVVPWRWSPLTLWLDKCCIDQNSDASKQAGIAHLGDSLERSRAMLVIFSASYLERLWCTYELAKFCRLIKRQRERAKEAEGGGGADAAAASDAEPQKSLLFLSLSWSAWWNPVNSMRAMALSADEDKLLSNYRCRKAKFFRRADQDTVLRMIRDEWGSEAAFDEFVNTELRDVLLAGKREYYQQAWREMWRSLIMLFN
jgi:hypothetical protein